MTAEFYFGTIHYLKFKIKTLTDSNFNFTENLVFNFILSS